MPDGSPPSIREAQAEMRHRREMAVAIDTMGVALWARAAVAWLQVVAPRKVPDASADSEGVAAHLALFARDPKYWERLCVLFDRRGLSDRGRHE